MESHLREDNEIIGNNIIDELFVDNFSELDQLFQSDMPTEVSQAVSMDFSLTPLQPAILPAGILDGDAEFLSSSASPQEASSQNHFKYKSSSVQGIPNKLSANQEDTMDSSLSKSNSQLTSYEKDHNEVKQSFKSVLEGMNKDDLINLVIMQEEAAFSTTPGSSKCQTDLSKSLLIASHGKAKVNLGGIKYSQAVVDVVGVGLGFLSGWKKVACDDGCQFWIPSRYLCQATDDRDATINVEQKRNKSSEYADNSSSLSQCKTLKILKCHRCHSLHKNSHSLTQHFRDMHDGKRYQCAKCAEYFSRKDLKKHIC